jgi:hypothetical protein
MNYRKTKAEVNQITHDIVLLEDNVLSIDLVSTIEADLKCHAQEKRGFFQLKNNNDAKINYRKTKAEVNQITHDIMLLEDNVFFSIGIMSTTPSGKILRSFSVLCH